MSDNKLTNEHNVQFLYLAITDESFLQQNLYIEGKDCFGTDCSVWIWDTARTHFRKYDELPSLSILAEHNKATPVEYLKTAVEQALGEIQQCLVRPPSNVPWLKDRFNALVETQKLKNAILQASDCVVSADPAKAKEILRDFISAPQHNGGTQPVSITLFKRPEANDPNELIKHRFLSRGGACLLIGPSGVGKSTLATQLAISWGLGRDGVGFTPTGPLKSLIIQAEDDSGDIGEMCDSVLMGLNIQRGSEEEQMLARNVKILSLNSACGDKFIAELDSHLATFTPDIVWINPVLSFLGGDTNSQKDVGKLLRNGLNPLLHKYNVACIGVHHIAKPSRDNKKNGWTGSDFQYAGLGSVEWTNWARCSLTIVNTVDPNVYVLRAGKRGKRLGWKDEITGENTIDKYISHSKESGVLYWTVTTKGAMESLSLSATTSNETYSKLLDAIPAGPDTITRQQVITVSGYGERTVDKYLKTMLASRAIKYSRVGKMSVYSRISEGFLAE